MSEVVYTYYTVGYYLYDFLGGGSELRIARDNHNKIREYKTPESAARNWARLYTNKDYVILKVEVSHLA